MGYDLDNQICAAQHKDFYDRFWSSVGTKTDYEELLRVYFIRDSIKRFTRGSRLKILDLGCGRGWMAPYLQPLGSVLGIDFSPEGIRFAKENYGGCATFMLADDHSPSLGLPRGSVFDVVVCSEVIEHVHDHGALLNQIAGFLPLHGWLMLTTPNGNVWSLWNEMKKGHKWQQPVENWITLEGLRNLVEQTGFKIATHEGGQISFRLPIHRGVGKFEVFLRKINLYSTYARLILPYALYQMVAAQKQQ